MSSKLDEIVFEYVAQDFKEENIRLNNRIDNLEEDIKRLESYIENLSEALNTCVYS